MFSPLRLLTILIIVLMLSPLAGIVGGAFFGDSPGHSPSVGAMFYYARQTALYAGGVTAAALCIALPAAWLTVMYRFRGNRLMSYLLLLPFAAPPYITAFALEDFFDAINVSALNMGAAIIFTSLSLYPYIYIFARAALRGQPCHIQTAARTMGYSPLSAAGRLSWPLARPAIIVGGALLIMETLNDVAVVEHFGIHTLGIVIYDLWLNRGDVFAACRLSFLMMLFVAAILMLEERARKYRQLHQIVCDKCLDCERAPVLSPRKNLAAVVFLSLPVMGGFILPGGWLVYLATTTGGGWKHSFVDGVVGSVVLSLSVAAVLLAAAVVFVLDKRYNGRGKIMHVLIKFSQMGYAVPGAILAQGFFLLSLFFSNLGGGVLVGGFALLVAACSARFFMITAGALDARMDKISPQLDAVSRLSARGPLSTFFRVHLPMLRPAMVAALILIFLEGFKELPMTLILRPFNFDTLATVVYQYAADESLELAAPAALTMMLIGAGAVSLLFALEGRDARTAARREK